MKFRKLEWKDHISNGAIIGSTCILKIYSYISIEFRISYEWNIGMYYLYTFGRGKLRKIPPDVFKSLEEAKAAAYEIYNNEMSQMKKSVDYLVVT